jgi:hypothetical protein
MSIKIADNSSLTVQTDPVIELNNGIRIWLGIKGEQIQIDPAAWAFISTAINHLQKIEVKNT